MRVFFIITILSISKLVFSDPFPIGLTVDFAVEEFEDPTAIWLPENYNSTSKWPVLFYYHGTSGKPTIEFLRLISESKDWVLVGMGYKQQGTFTYTEENLANEIKIFKTMLTELEKKVTVDHSKIYVSGMSKGGWMTGLFLQKIPELAGGLILGGGLIEAKPGKFYPGDKVFIGAGESDGNIAMSYGARDKLKANGVEVTLDIWPGLGHQLPNIFTNADLCVKISQWLKVQSGKASQEEAINWCDLGLREIQKKGASDKVSAFHQLVAMSDMPFLDLVDKESTVAVKDLQTAYRKDPELNNEMAAWVAFQKAVSFEGRDRYVSTLAEALAKYQNLTETYPDTVFGAKAAQSRDRVKLLLGIE